jgi:hypothetical protein
MHTIGCPAASFFLPPKLKNALVWTTDPRPPAVRARDLEDAAFVVNTFLLDAAKKFGCAINALEEVAIF